MKVTKNIVRQFENEQKQFGSEIAIKNVIWILASEMLNNIGVTKIHTSYKKLSPTQKKGKK